MLDAKALMALELAKVPTNLRDLAVRFGEDPEFVGTYGLDQYRSTKLLRSLSAPHGLAPREVAAYLQIAFNVTYLRDRFRCQYCDLDGLSSAGAYGRIQVDHLVPIAPREEDVWGGISDEERFILANGPENLACACAGCNPAKGNGLFGLTPSLARDAKIKMVRQQLNLAGKPHRYEQEYLGVAAFLDRNR